MARMCIAIFATVIATAYATFDDFQAFEAVQLYRASAETALQACGADASCVSDRVATRVLESLSSLPIPTVEAVYNHVLGKKDVFTVSQYIDSVYLKRLTIQFGSDVAKLNNVLKAFFNTTITAYYDDVTNSEKTFEEVASDLLRQLRRELKVWDGKAADFWNAINTLRAYGSQDVMQALEGYTKRTIIQLGFEGEQSTFCRSLLDTATSLGNIDGFHYLQTLITQACTGANITQDGSGETIVLGLQTTPTTEAVPSSTSTANPQPNTTTKKPSYNGKCGSKFDPTVSRQLRTTLVSLRVINGQTVAKGEYKFLATLMRRGGVICTASIIDPTHILTAAHCTEGSTASDLSVGVAEFDITQVDGEKVYQVEKVTNHPQYDSRKVINDISILTLTQPIAGVPNAEPVCLPRWKQCKTISNRKCVVAGWGAKKIVDNTRKSFEVHA
ncbi:uncharacterized protein LOC124116280 [Haliotis rufescens]|uniref:uncharacterized protein LOC124116280 n=1 Tax=Haliotis rufescens TaxID=6454 RepID=UPI00201F764C|nr:uncharacterized protein LOC124116280 [Haliotis rufescens]